MAGGSHEAHFFYCQLCPRPESRETETGGERVCDDGFLHHIAVLRGLGAFLGDIDGNRETGKEGGIVGACLTEAANNPEVLNAAVEWVSSHAAAREPELYYRTPREYRERYLIESMRRMSRGV